MTRINVRLDDVVGGFSLLPDAWYTVEIQESSKIKRSRDSGENYIGWIGRILDGEYEGKNLYWMTSLQPDALWNLKTMLEAMGFEWDEDGFELEDIFGHEVAVEVFTEEYGGQPRNYVRSYTKVE